MKLIIARDSVGKLLEELDSLIKEFLKELNKDKPDSNEIKRIINKMIIEDHSAMNDIYKICTFLGKKPETRPHIVTNLQRLIDHCKLAIKLLKQNQILTLKSTIIVLEQDLRKIQEDAEHIQTAVFAA